MSERDDNPNQFFEVDERRIFPRPLPPPVRINRPGGPGLGTPIRMAIGIMSTIALVMIIFGITAYELSSVGSGMWIPAYGLALLIFSFAEFIVLRYISETE